MSAAGQAAVGNVRRRPFACEGHFVGGAVRLRGGGRHEWRSEQQAKRQGATGSVMIFHVTLLRKGHSVSLSETAEPPKPRFPPTRTAKLPLRLIARKMAR